MTVGDCTTDDAEGEAAKAKCHAWCAVKGMSKANAEKEYVTFGTELLKKAGAL